MFEWFHLDEAAAIITDATGKRLGARDLLRMAFAGELKVSSVIPGWVSPGVGELVFYAPPPDPDSDSSGSGVDPDSGRDDSVKTHVSGRMASVTDGLFRHLGMYDFQTLRNHSRLPLAGKKVVLRDSDGAETNWVIGPEAPTITLEDLRVSADEVARIEAELGGKPKPVDAAAGRADTVLAKREILDRLRLRFPELENAWKRNEKWIQGAKVQRGRYRLEAIEAGCRQMWPKEAVPCGEARLSTFGQLSAIR